MMHYVREEASLQPIGCSLSDMGAHRSNAAVWRENTQPLASAAFLGHNVLQTSRFSNFNYSQALVSSSRHPTGVLHLGQMKHDRM